MYVNTLVTKANATVTKGIEGKKKGHPFEFIE